MSDSNSNQSSQMTRVNQLHHILVCFCGDRRIRTYGTLVTPNGFQDRHNDHIYHCFFSYFCGGIRVRFGNGRMQICNDNQFHHTPKIKNSHISFYELCESYSFILNLVIFYKSPDIYTHYSLSVGSNTRKNFQHLSVQTLD